MVVVIVVVFEHIFSLLERDKCGGKMMSSNPLLIYLMKFEVLIPLCQLTLIIIIRTNVVLFIVFIFLSFLASICRVLMTV